MTDVVEFDGVVALAKQGGASTGEVLVALLNATLMVPSMVDFDSKVPFEPLLLTIDEMSYMVVFTLGEHAKNFESVIKTAATMSGKDVVVGIKDPAVGLLINPGAEAGYQVDGSVVANLAAYALSVSAGK